MDEWGAWIEHDGKGCPVVGQMCLMTFEDFPGFFGNEQGIAMGGASWFWDQWCVEQSDGFMASRIIRYRVRKPSALLDLIRAAENPTDPDPVNAPPELVPA